MKNTDTTAITCNMYNTYILTTNCRVVGSRPGPSAADLQFARRRGNLSASRYNLNLTTSFQQNYNNDNDKIKLVRRRFLENGTADEEPQHLRRHLRNTKLTYDLLLVACVRRQHRYNSTTLSYSSAWAYEHVGLRLKAERQRGHTDEEYEHLRHHLQDATASVVLLPFVAKATLINLSSEVRRAYIWHFSTSLDVLLVLEAEIWDAGRNCSGRFQPLNIAGAIAASLRERQLYTPAKWRRWQAKCWNVFHQLAPESTTRKPAARPIEEPFRERSSHSDMKYVPRGSNSQSENGIRVQHITVGAMVAERLACSPPTKEIRVQSPAGSLRIFACVNSAGRCRWSSGYLGDPPFPHPFIPALLHPYLNHHHPQEQELVIELCNGRRHHLVFIVIHRCALLAVLVQNTPPRDDCGAVKGGYSVNYLVVSAAVPALTLTLCLHLIAAINNFSSGRNDIWFGVGFHAAWLPSNLFSASWHWDIMGVDNSLFFRTSEYPACQTRAHGRGRSVIMLKNAANRTDMKYKKRRCTRGLHCNLTKPPVS
ncbi:hypothetical protein PR048_007304 [Dryococelus australis]|uniref:Uncharacterized protein n=1 Tax=Dryococelus australis TaxID=614101 RepID=A0ABQ9IEJ1_9NEOP|nr:hypothetical protein PR048_007304 [Dryococelus australis]